jgi:hypothetical protein
MPDWTSTQTFDIPNIDIIGVAATLTALGVIIIAVRALLRFGKRVNVFLDDWYGSDGDEQHPPVLGVLNRVGAMEGMLHQHIRDEDTVLAAMGSEVTAIKTQVGHELNRNGGTSTKDAAHEALRVVKEVQVQQEAEIIARRADRDEFRAENLAHAQRLMTFFALVRRMIVLPPSDQIALWDDATAAFADGNLTQLDDEEQ